MTTFDDRERMEEGKFVHEQELAFKIRNRRNKLFGFWLAESHLGLSGDAVADYAKAVIMADFSQPRSIDAMSKAKADLKDAGVEISDHTLSKRMIELEAEARKQVMSE